MTRTKQSELTPILTALERIEAQSRWAFTEGMWKAGKGLTAERGVVHQPRHSNDDIDFVPGNTWDIDEGGNANARAAYRKAVEAVINARSVVELLVAVTVGPQREHVRLEGAAPHPNQFCAAIYELKVNCGRLEEVGELPAKREVRHAGRLLDAAAAALDRAVGAPVQVDQGADKGAPEHKKCRNCPRWIGASTTGPRCAGCKKHLQRHGVERPQETITPQQAKAKRQARGEDWGQG